MSQAPGDREPPAQPDDPRPAPGAPEPDDAAPAAPAAPAGPAAAAAPAGPAAAAGPAAPEPDGTRDDTPLAPEPDDRPGRLDRLSLAVVIALIVMATLTGLLAMAFFDRSETIRTSLRYDDRGIIEDAAAQDLLGADRRVAAAARRYLLGVVVAGPLFITWQYRCARKADALHPLIGVGRPAWAIAGWFIPIANLVLPGMQLSQASRAFDPALPAGKLALQGRSRRIVWTWAVLVGLSAVAMFLASGPAPEPQFMTSESEYVERLARREDLLAFACLLLGAAAIAGAVMVRDLARAQAAKLRAVGL